MKRYFKQGSILFYTLTALLLMGILFTATTSLYFSQRHNFHILTNGIVAQAIGERSLQLFRREESNSNKQIKVIENKQTALKQQRDQIEKKYREIEKDGKESKEEVLDEELKKNVASQHQRWTQYRKELERLDEKYDTLEEDKQSFLEQKKRLRTYQFNLGSSKVAQQVNQIICEVVLSSSGQIYHYEYPVK